LIGDVTAVPWQVNQHCQAREKVKSVVRVMMMLQRLEPASVVSMLPNEVLYLIFELL